MPKIKVRPKGRDHFLPTMERSDTTTLVTFNSDGCKSTIMLIQSLVL
jgi:hypothetical protein